ncbi:hypothetical protein F8M41_022474 [Gigaspora margarita]|uniref:Uncharacterized protein n=1 Tax=Gigaspora margarita TaxID=4874 RepID=A0A8H4AEY7_GIGMA|nr:hypothetical protein F8M41_022474 [Gigaspora margarita]
MAERSSSKRERKPKPLTSRNTSDSLEIFSQSSFKQTFATLSKKKRKLEPIITSNEELALKSLLQTSQKLRNMQNRLKNKKVFKNNISRTDNNYLVDEEDNGLKKSLLKGLLTSCANTQRQKNILGSKKVHKNTILQINKKSYNSDCIENDDDNNGFHDLGKRGNNCEERDTREDNLSSAFFEKGIVTITKDIQKISLYPTAELFKDHLESYVEKQSKGYIKDIGERRWDSRFYSEFLPIAEKILSKNDIMNIQDDSRDESNANDYNDNNIEEHSENDTDEDARLFE